MADIFVSKKVQNEIEKSFIWYQKTNSIIADTFVKELNNKFDEAGKHPLRYSIKKKPYRETILNKFPFSIIYKYYRSKKVVFIISVFHFKRNPKKKYK